MNTKRTHYSNFGVTGQPPYADPEGYLEYREDFEDLPREQWTEAERYIDYHCRRIEAWREEHGY